jgi:hypothetical protein
MAWQKVWVFDAQKAPKSKKNMQKQGNLLRSVKTK